MLRTTVVSVIFGFWFVPAFEAVLLAVGITHFHTGYARNPKRFSRLIVQVTTTGREPARVNEIIADIRSMALSMPYEVWVVKEPRMRGSYPLADRVLVVYRDFHPRSRDKARALEFARLVRKDEGLNGPDTKILFLDDDTSPTHAYIEEAFAGDYDLCQGVTAPRIEYGRRSLRHFLLSHFDDLRLLGCVVYCSFFQGVVRRPVYVHGEGLCMTGEVEDLVTWDYPIFASEDLVFGQNAVALGLRWGFFHEYIQLTSPWTFTDFMKQRRRWLWGNLHAIVDREVIPLRAAVSIVAKYALSFSTIVMSNCAILLVATHVVHISTYVSPFHWLGFGCWMTAYFMSGWVSSQDPSERSRWRALPRRLFQAVSAAALAPLTSAVALLVLVIAFFQGDPKSFDVIAKTAHSSRTERHELRGRSRAQAAAR